MLARGLDMAEAAPSPKAAALPDPVDGVVWRWSLLVFISGFLIVALQIVWYRLIGVLLQSNGYSFSLVLAVFLLGDAAGLLVGARMIDRIADPRRFFFLMQGVATTLALCGAWFVYLAIGADILPSTFVDRDIMSGKAANIALIVLLLLVVVLPASFIMGFSFPVVQKAVQRDLDRLGSRVGLVQLANIVGNSMGSLVAGLLLLDLVGTAGTLKLLVAIGLAFAVLQLFGARSTRWAYAARRAADGGPGAVSRRRGLLAAPARPHRREGHRRRGQDRPQPAEAGRRPERQALHPGPFPEPPAVRHRAHLPRRHRAADARRRRSACWSSAPAPAARPTPPACIRARSACG